jgi:hypothetical protein
VQEISLSPGVWIYRYERQVERRSLGFSEKMVKQINKGVDIEVVVDKYLEEA